MYNKNEICIGKEKPGHKSFCDAENTTSLLAPFTICEIKVQYTKNQVLGLKIKYRGADGKKITGQSSRKLKIIGVKKQKLKIEKYDYVREIFGYADDQCIHQIGFRTYKGDCISCGGNNQGIAFSYAHQNSTYVNASGNHDKCLEFIKFQIQQLTQTQINLLPIKPN